MKMIRRLEPAALVLLLIALGCQQLKEIPLFNPEASLRNKIASAREVRTEINNKLVEFRTMGWLSQADIDKNFSPSLDTSKALVDEAEALRVAGDAAGGLNKMNAAKAILTAIRTHLSSIEKERKL